MPRTKVKKTKPLKPTLSDDDREKLLKTFSLYADKAKLELERALALQVKHFNDAYQMCLATLGNVDLQKTLQQIRDEHAKANITPPTTGFTHPLGITSMASQRSVSSNRDDGYVTDAGRPVNKKNTRLSRSLSRSNATATSGDTQHSYDSFETAAAREMVVSLSGSPLLVNSISTIDEQPNCNIPLEDGTMISLMPSQMRQSTANIPFEFMHQGVIDQLSTLRNNIDIVVRLGQKTIHKTLKRIDC